MNLPMPEYGATQQETIDILMDTVVKLRKELEYALYHLDEQNIPSLTGMVGDIDGNHTLIEQNESSINLLAEDVAGNSSQILIESGRIDQNVTDIEGNSAQIVIQAGEIQQLVTDVDGNSTAITQNANQITSVAEDVSGNNTLIQQNSTSIGLHATRLDDAEASLIVQADEIVTKVSKTSVINSINNSAEVEKITESLLSLTNTNNAINAVDGKADTNATNITSVDNKANANNAEILTLISRVVTAETNINQNATDISLKASQSALDTISSNLTGVETRVSSAEASINVNANAITQKVSTTDYNGNTIVSKVNQTAGAYSIDASTIDLNGIVKVSDSVNLGSTSTAGKVIFRSGVEIYTGGLFGAYDLVLDPSDNGGNVYVTTGLEVADYLDVVSDLSVRGKLSAGDTDMIDAHVIYGDSFNVWTDGLFKYNGYEVATKNDLIARWG